MPTHNDRQREGPDVHEKILQQIHRMDQNLQAIGLGPMDPQQLRGAYEKIKSAVAQIVSQQGQGRPQVAAPRPLMQAVPPTPAPTLPLSTFAEGGFANDSSGQQTQQLRRRLGIR